MAEADEIIKATEGPGVVLMLAENYRFYPPVVIAKRLLLEGAIGEMTGLLASSWQSHRPGGWRRNLERYGGGALIDRGIHFVDIALNFGGCVETVFALRPLQVVTEMEGEDCALLLMKHASGVVSEVNVA